MKIAFVVYGFPYYSQTFVHQQIADTIKAGHTVSIISAFHPNPDRINTVVAENQLLSYVLRLGVESELLKELDRYSSFQEFERDRAEPLPKFRSPVVEQIKNYDFLHGSFGNNSATVAMLLSAVTGIPFSFDLHAYDLFVDFSFGQEKIDRATFFTTVCEYNRQFLEKNYNFPPDKLTVLPGFCDSERLKQVPKRDRIDGRIVSVGRLVPIKGVLDTVRAFAGVVEQYPHATLHVVGDGEQREEIERCIFQLGLESQVKLLGELSNDEVYHEIVQASLFVLASRIGLDGDRDALPVAIMEAMYLGTPVISTRVSGIPELIEDQSEGILVPSGDIQTLEGALRTLLGDRQLREQFGKAASEKAQANFGSAEKRNKLFLLWEEAGS